MENINIVEKVPSDFYPDRKADYRLSRYALSGLINLKNLEITNHKYMTEDESVLVSLSHSKGIAAAIIDRDPKLESIGIDVEWSNRTIKSGIEKFFLNDKDDQSLTRLEIWSVKESAFKAYSPIYTANTKEQKTLVLKDFHLRNGKFYIKDKPLGTYQLSYERFSGSDLLISKAKILKASDT